MNERTYICIDLKSFYASAECAERGLDPFKTNLVVADASRGKGSVCLAITPAMKKLGVKNRCRLFEIPPNIKYITALPHMKRYMEISAEIYGIYLKFVSREDIHIYSVDECFIDVTSYLLMYKMTARQLAVFMMEEVRKNTGISAAAGIGTNLFLAKVALDITAKHSPDSIGYLDDEEFRKTIWHHQPITDIWNIGRGTAKRLEKYGVHDLYDISCLDSRILYREFGVNAQYLIDHANGIEPCTISDIKNYHSENQSISNSQILFRDYDYDEAWLIVKEMVNNLTMELTEKNLVTDSISLYVSYSKNVIKSDGGTMKTGEYTNSYKKLVKYFEKFYHSRVKKNYPIRKISVGFNNLADESFSTVTLFTDFKAEEKERRLQNTIADIKNRYGKNSLIKGISLDKASTAQMRNKLIGGHNG